MFGRANQDVLAGRTPLRESPIPGLSNATYIVNRKYKKDDISFDKEPNKTGLQNFGNWIDQFTKNPSKKQLSKAVELLKQGTASGI